MKMSAVYCVSSAREITTAPFMRFDFVFIALSCEILWKNSEKMYANKMSVVSSKG